jgi:hypothetical protein
MRYMVESNFVEVLGTIWMPACNAAMRIPLSSYDLETIEDFTRENVEDWLGCHAGDFQKIIDFRASAGDVEIPWENEDNEMEFNDLMYPLED